MNSHVSSQPSVEPARPGADRSQRRSLHRSQHRPAALRPAALTIGFLLGLLGGCATPERPPPPPKPGSVEIAPDGKVLLRGPVQLDHARFTAPTPAAGTTGAIPRLWISREQDCSDGFDVEAPQQQSGALAYGRIVVEPGRMLCGSADPAGTLAYDESLPKLERVQGPQSEHPTPAGRHHLTDEEMPGGSGSPADEPGRGSPYPTH